MEFMLLGTVEARKDGQLVSISAGKHRAVLAILLLRANHVVSGSEIIEGLWGERPPVGARKTVQGYVARLRKILGQEVIRTRPPGYLVLVSPGGLDLDRFEALAGQASHEPDPVQRASLLSAALAVWRGAPLADVASDQLQRLDAVRLAERRLQVINQRIEVDLELGKHADLIPELHELTTAHPLHEGFVHQLILALYRAGRRADALAAYRGARRRFVDEFGMEPGAELHALHQRILAADAEPPRQPEDAAAALPGPEAAGQQPAGRPPMVPSQLPPDLPDFVGRRAEVAWLAASLLVGPDAAAGPVPVVAISGQGGIGKTAIGLRVSHQLRDRFPDGQLYVDMHGSGENPVDPSEALARLLRALGIDDATQPASLEERTAMFRSVTAGRRILLLLDDAADETAVRALLPSSSLGAAVITSRRALAGLEGARHQHLDLLPTGDAVRILARVAGPERIRAEPALATEIVQLCGNLPLAVRIAGARLASRPQHPLSWLVGRLADERRRLDELSIGDLALRANMWLSYRGLTEPARRALRLLGLLDVPTSNGWVLAALLDIDIDESHAVLDALADHRMLDVFWYGAGGEACYRLHALVHLFARERLAADEPPEQARQALARLLARAAAMASGAAAALRLTPLTVPPRLAGGAVSSGTGASAAAGQHPGLPAADRGGWEPADPAGWFERELPTLVAAVVQAAAQRLDAACVDLAWELWPYLRLHANFELWRMTVDAALAATERLRDDRRFALALSGRGSLHEARGEYELARTYFSRALLAFRAAGDGRGVARMALVHCSPASSGFRQSAESRSAAPPWAARPASTQ